MAAQKPNTTATKAQRNGQDMALRTAMCGALTVKRRNKRRSFMQMRVWQVRYQRPRQQP
jgi:hypothetical protein